MTAAPAQATGLPEDAGALCLGLVAAAGALRDAMDRDDAAALIARDAELRAIAARLGEPGRPGIARGQVLAALVEALDAVRDAQSWLLKQRARQEAGARQTERLRLAYSDGRRRY
ncbi:hypothetical protein [Rhodobacter sp. NSM]|uniref:hypothetical protein n=1 Tax=Rhodobacter sp. NSM TaxID=3457501 RepID=UPI003FD5CB0B